MKRQILAVLAIVSLMALSPRKLIKTKIDNGITVSLPKELTAMTPEDIALRYPSVRAPLGAFTNEDRLVDFSANLSATQWPDGDVKFAQNFFKSTIYNMYDKVNLISEGLIEQHKKKFFFFEFDSRLNADRKNVGTQDALFRYTYIMYLVEPKRTLVFSFNCTKEQKEEWQETARAIMQTVRVK